MNTVPAFLRRSASLALWGGLSGLFALFLGMGSVALGAAILLMPLLLLTILAGPQFIMLLWLVGSPTIYNIFNQVLKALPFITMERLLFVLLVGVLTVRAAFAGGKRQPRLRLETLIVVFLAYMLGNLAVHTNEVLLRNDLWFFLQYAMPMLVFGISRRIQWSERGIRILLACLTATGLLLTLIGILQSVFGLTIFTQDYQDVTAGHVGRAYGTFSNAHTYIATLFILLTVTVFQFGAYRDGLVRFGLLGALLLMAVGIVLGQTRAPWGGAALALFIIMLRDRSVRPLLVAGAVLASIAGAVLVVVMIDQLGAFVDRVTNLHTMAGRLATWATALNMVFHNPACGVGFGADAFEMNKPEYITGVGSLSAQYAVYLSIPHNEYLHVAVLLGIPGLVLFVAILVGVVKLMFSIHADPDSPPLRRRMGLYAGAIIIGLMFNSLFSDTYVQDYFWMLAWFLAGFVAGLPKVQRSDEAPRGKGDLT